MCLFVYIFVCLGVPPLLLIFLAGAGVYSKWIESYDGLFLSPSGISYNYDFLVDFQGRLMNTLPVFKGLWFELIGGVDHLSIIFILMVHVVALMTLAFSSLYFIVGNYRQSVRDLESFKIAIFAVLIMSFFLDILFLTTNLVVMFILAELTLLPLSFLMLKDGTVFWRSSFERFGLLNKVNPNKSSSPLNDNFVSVGESQFENKRPLAFYYLIFFTIISGGVGLFGISLIYLNFGTTSLVTLSSVELSRPILEFLALFSTNSGESFLTNYSSFLCSDYISLVVALFLLVF